MHKTLVLWGGMGSVHINAVIHKHVRLVCRPDVALSLLSGLDRRPDEREIAIFEKRSGFVLDSEQDLEESLLDFLAYMRKADIRMTLGCLWYKQWFTRNTITDLVFLIRHPLYMYMSLCGRRHSDWKASKGLDSIESVTWFAERWNRLVSEGLGTKSPFIRFEYAKDDFERCDIAWLKPAIDTWRCNHRGPVTLSKPVISCLRQLTEDLYLKLYPTWSI
jgi:hypothetical protein